VLEPSGATGEATEDWYAYDLPGPGRVVGRLLQCPPFTGLDNTPTLELFEANSPTALLTADQPCASFESMVLPTGTYLVRVSFIGVDLSNGIEYTLGVTDLPPPCGDGMIQAPEACDDGNRAPFDTCTPECRDDPTYITSADNRGSTMFNLPGLSTPLPIHPLAPGAEARDRGVSILRFPFAFPYFGHRHKGVFVYTDGFLAFEPGHSTSPLGPTLPNSVVAPFAADLNLEQTGGGFGTYESSYMGATITIVDLDGLQIRGQPATHLEARVAFANTGQIVFRYGDNNGNPPVQAGIENAESSLVLPVPPCGQGGCSIQDLPSQQLIEFHGPMAPQ
jgi:cysteine-rich repeat protein